MLRTINAMVPKALRLNVPSLITNDYVNVALSRVRDALEMYYFAAKKTGSKHLSYTSRSLSSAAYEL